MNHTASAEGGLEMAHLGAAELKRRLRELATTTFIARHLPPMRDQTTNEGGGRHDYALALSGFLLRSGRLGEQTALKILTAAWDAKGWPDVRSKSEAHHDLEGIVRDTVENLIAGEPVVGGPTLEDLAPGVVRLLFKWWGWARKANEEEPTEDTPEEKEERRSQADRLRRTMGELLAYHEAAAERYLQAEPKRGLHDQTSRTPARETPQAPSSGGGRPGEHDGHRRGERGGGYRGAHPGARGGAYGA